MKRKTSTTPTRVWAYGLPFGPDRECWALVDEQMRLAHQYRKKLIEIEQERMGAYREARRRHAPEFAALEDEWDRLDVEIEQSLKHIKDARRRHAAKHIAEARKLDPQARVKSTMLTRVVDPDSKARIKELKVQRAEVGAQLKAARKAASAVEALQEEAKRIDEQAKVAHKAARAACGVYWGTYLLVENAVDRARMDSTKQGRAPRKITLDQAISRAEGKSIGGHASVGVQIQKQKPLTTEGVLSGGDTRLRIWTSERRSTGKANPSQVGKARTRHHVAIRVGSEGKQRRPVWATFTLNYHRPLPPLAQIKWAWVQRRKVSMHKFRWELCLAIESETFEAPTRLPTHACAVNVGWRLEDDGALRVGYAVGTDGHEERIECPESVRSALRHARDLRGIRDKHLDKLKERMAEWVALLPEAWRERFDGWERWRGPKRFAELAYEMRSAIGMDDPAVAPMVAWAKRDNHLGEWEAREREKALRRRREHYRLVARRLAQRYSTIVVDKTDLRELAKRSTPDVSDDLEEAQRLQRFDAAPHTVRDALVLMASNTGAALVKATASGASVKCHVCGAKAGKGAALWHTCESCGAAWDQDANHCRNLLAFRQSEDDDQDAE